MKPREKIFFITLFVVLVIISDAIAQNKAFYWDGNHWLKISFDGKAGYLFGLGNMADYEVTYGKGSPGISPVFVEKMKTPTIKQVIEAIDMFYKDNPGKLNTKVLDVLLAGPPGGVLSTAKGSAAQAGGSGLDNALIDAATKADLASVKDLLDRGANVNARAAGGATPLIMAAVNGRLPVVHVLLAKGADVNARDDNGSTALLDAAEFGHLPVIQALLAKGADVNARDKEGRTALSYAQESFDLSNEVRNEVMNVLRRAGAR